MGDEKTFEELPYSQPGWEHQFPLLQHLILVNVPDEPYFGGIALSSSTIKRLTFQFVGQEWVDDTYDILAAMLAVNLGRYHPGDGSGPRIWWPELQTLAVSAPLAPRMLQNMTVIWQNLHRQTPKLMLPTHLCAQAGTEAMEELEKVAKVEDFTLDWPTPFEQFK
ncbi:hypothetical protein FIBSPDRAFT_884196 [Athelia psychrophila]|uniref:Uncharacterized protein n=1 Tax=Athelia psychrophila TaxID=1759441 RepID=A0A166T7A5_9AGAM|nr:hypothetical protein FIBSPDRAFT_884196 [Fibularhizoctonia sp. CBS 109695]